MYIIQQKRHAAPLYRTKNYSYKKDRKIKLSQRLINIPKHTIYRKHSYSTTQLSKQYYNNISQVCIHKSHTPTSPSHSTRISLTIMLCLHNQCLLMLHVHVVEFHLISDVGISFSLQENTDSLCIAKITRQRQTSAAILSDTIKKIRIECS